MLLAVAAGVAAALGTLFLLIRAASGALGVSCEVCVTYRGRTACREALGPDREQATRTALDNACAFLASGMTEVVECTTRTAPEGVTCREP
jgi:hypothetical protein